MRMSKGEETLLWALTTDGYRMPEAEVRFHPKRKWRFDYAWRDLKIAIEVEGVTPGGGRHQRMIGYEGDCTKYNAAQLLGWIVLRFTPRQCLKETIKTLATVAEAHRIRRESTEKETT